MGLRLPSSIYESTITITISHRLTDMIAVDALQAGRIQGLILFLLLFQIAFSPLGLLPRKRGSENNNDPQLSQPCTLNSERSQIGSSQACERPSKAPRVEMVQFDASSLERDPGLRKSIWEYLPKQQDEVRRAYIKFGPYQPTPPRSSEYVDKNGRRFLPSWYKLFPNWLEFSPSKNAAFCLPCFLFNKPFGRQGTPFTVDGFRSWKKVNDGSHCALIAHVGVDANSSHKKAVRSYIDLENSLQHIERVIEKQTSQQIARNRLQLKVSIDAVKWLTFQGCAFRGRDEAQDSRNRELIDSGDIETGRGKNQVGTLQRPGDTRWSSHLTSLCSLMRMFNSTCAVLRDIIKSGNLTQRSEADGVYDVMTSFEFIFILQFMIEVLGITDDLCQALQRKSQDILNAMQLVSSTKALLQKFRESGWDSLLEKVKSFCEERDVEIPNLNARYKAGRGRPRHQTDDLTVEHHYRFDIFVSAMDSLLQEMNFRFKDDVVELLVLSFALDPRDDYKSFRVEDVCKLVNDFYPNDFTDHEKQHLKIQLEHFEIDARKSSELKKVSTIAELCQVLAKTGSCTPSLDRC